MTDQEQKQPIQEKKARFKFYNYKAFFLISIALFLLCIGILVNNFLQTGDFVKRGIELQGGTLVSLNLPTPADTAKIQNSLAPKFQGVIVKEIRGVSGYELSVEAASTADPNKILEELKSLGLSTEKHSIRSVGAALGSSFFQQVQVGLIVSFILMSIVVFIMFRAYAPSIAVILSAIFDIVETMAFMQVFGIELTLSSFAALLMLVGYSVDTDILLTSRVMKTGSSIPIPERVKGAMKTGMTMTLTTMAALLVLLISNLSPVLSEIASVLLIGLALDTVNTWIQSVAIIRRYAEKKGI